MKNDVDAKIILPQKAINMPLHDEIKEEFREDSMSDSEQEFIDKILETSPHRRESNPESPDLLH